MKEDKGEDIMDLYEPKDNEYYKKIYEPQGNGVCGVAILAVLTRSSLKQILRIWKNYIGYTSHSELKRMLKILGYDYKQKQGHKGKTFPYLENKIHICRIQWVGKEGGKYHGYKSWHEACSNTHWILIEADMFYCNGDGWAELRWLPEYLEEGYITSYLEITKSLGG